MRLIIIFCFLSLFFWGEIGFAESPGIKITQPLNGVTVTPGQEITVTVGAVGGFVIKGGRVGVAGLPKEKITILPTTLDVTIPNEAIGEVIIHAFGYGELSKFVSDSITLNVQQTATLQSLEINQDEIFVDLDWDGNIKEDRSGDIVTVYGIFSDGVKRELDNDPATTYTSSDDSVISIDNKGKFQVYKVGEAAITVSNSGISKVIPVVFKPPRGIRPEETIPPTTQINIQPQANPDGWRNRDITISLTATDNEGGSGVKEIEYVLAGLTGMKGIKSEDDTIEGSTAQLSISQEGIARLGYRARDNERNAERMNFVDLRLDKTPPFITPIVLPQPNPYSWNNTNVTVSFDATDNLSGIKSASQPVTVTHQGANHHINGEAIDIADNKSTVSVTVNIDKTPPKLSITAMPNILWPPNNKMVNVTINGRAADNLSGIDSLIFKVIDEYGSVQPVITGFGSVIKLEASRDANDQDSRVYTIFVTAKDKAGNGSQASTTVTVPFHAVRQGKK